MQGLHLTADLSHCQCDAACFTNAPALMAHCLAAVEASGLKAVGQLAHTFPASSEGPGGVTATVLLAESHLCVHTWPEQAAVTVDVYVCNFGADHSAQAHHLLQAIIALFLPGQANCQTLRRGLSDPASQDMLSNE